MNTIQIISKIGHMLAVAGLALSFYLVSPQVASSQAICALLGWGWFSAIAESIPIIDFHVTRDNERLHPKPEREWNQLKRQTAVDIFGWNFFGIVIFALIVKLTF